MHDLEFYEDTHTYLLDGQELPSVTTILSLLNGEHYKAIAPSVLANASRRGTAVHEFAELTDYDAMPDTVDGDCVPYCKAYLQFLKDYEPEWERIEYMTHLGNLFAGTIDRSGVIEGKECVLDIKTSTPTKIAYVSLCCQTSAYATMLGAIDCERYGLFLKKDGTYRLFNCKEYEQKNGFSGIKLFTKCLTFYREREGILNAENR